jgi:UDP-N-acetylmuramoyl-L-alanyl-D-glutamate--2,6-diaminopimelate ligase
MKKLKDMVAAIQAQGIEGRVRMVGSPSVEVTHLADDSRHAQPGGVFVAMAGSEVDGVRYLEDALQRGVSVLVVPEATAIEGLRQVYPQATWLLVEHPRVWLARLAALWFEVQPPIRLAVTGTNGKTSVVHFIRCLGDRLGIPTLSVGTLGFQSSAAEGWFEGPSLTTPSPLHLHRGLADAVRLGIRAVAIEASSHGLDQHRLDGMASFDAAGFTSFSQDHLDYHGSMQAYFASKMRLFNGLLDPGKTAVLHSDMAEFPVVEAMAASRGLQLCPYGFRVDDPRGLRVVSVTLEGWYQRAVVEHQGHQQAVLLPLIGGFQLMNALCAAGMVAYGMGIPMPKVLDMLESLTPVPGRMEQLMDPDTGRRAVIDFAHTPDALEKLLVTLRPLASGRLILVMGCGGDRDRGKRPQMGAIADRLADMVIITDDNPRHEDPALIRRAIASACPRALQIAPRDHAIAVALEQATPQDIVVVAGRGHETHQTIGDERHAFLDREVTAELMRQRGR